MNGVELIESSEMAQLMARIEELLEVRVVALVVQTHAGRVGVISPEGFASAVSDALHRLGED